MGCKGPNSLGRWMPESTLHSCSRSDNSAITPILFICKKPSLPLLTVSSMWAMSISYIFRISPIVMWAINIIMSINYGEV